MRTRPQKRLFRARAAFATALSTFGSATVALASDAPPSCPAAAGDIPQELRILAPQYEELSASLCPRSTAWAQREVARAQVATAESADSPTVSLSSSAGLQQSWTFENTDRTNGSDTYTKNLSAGVELSKRLWSAGNDALSIETARLRLKSQEADERGARTQAWLEFTRDLLRILNSGRTLAQKEKELEKWKVLNAYTHRKASGGHLSQRDTLQSDKETVSAENEVVNARAALERDLDLLMTRHDIRENRITIATLAKLEASFAGILKLAQNALGKPELADDVARRSADLEKNRIQREMQALDLKQKTIQELNPELRAVAGLNGNYIDNANRTTPSLRGAKPPEPNWSLTGNVGLRFSMSLWNPRGQSLSEESRLQSAQWAAQEASLLRTLQVQCESWKTEYATTEARLAGQRKVLATVEKLASGNNQLYEAGLVDTFQVIRGLQDLYTQERAVIELENQLRTTALNSLLAQLFGRL